MATTVATKAIDLERYPVHDLNGPGRQALVARCRSELASHGAAELPGFLGPDALTRIVGEVAELRGAAYRTETTHNVEFSGKEAELAADDPLRIEVRSAKSCVAYDQIPPSSLLRAVYETDEVTRFVGSALEVDPLYRQADEVGALNVMFYEPGDELGWHFDNADFVVTLMLQPSSAGGVFEYVPMLRTPDDRNPAGVGALLRGARDDVLTMSAGAGTLALFRGRLSPHRVTPVAGEKPRVNAVMSYAQDPAARLTSSARRIFYGRE